MVTVYIKFVKCFTKCFIQRFKTNTLDKRQKKIVEFFFSLDGIIFLMIKTTLRFTIKIK